MQWAPITLEINLFLEWASGEYHTKSMITSLALFKLIESHFFPVGIESHPGAPLPNVRNY